MSPLHTFLPNYSVGETCYHSIPWVTRRFGKKAVVIGGKTAMSKAKEALLEGIAGSDVTISDFLWFGGNSTYEHAQALCGHEAVAGADMIFAVGGGRAIDTCKVVADRLDKPLFAFPTIASNCAACTALSVIYRPDGSMLEYFYPPAPPEHTFINTKIIAEAPQRLLWAGIGDALSKEPEVLLSTRGKTLNHSVLLGKQLSMACTSPLMEYGPQALEDCRNGRASLALEQVALDIIITTGLVSNLTVTKEEDYYNSSLAHAFYNGSTVIPGVERHLHGELVSFGVLCLLTYDKQYQERERYARFNQSLGLPVCLKDLDLEEKNLPALADRAAQTLEWSCVPYEMQKEAFIQAILEADAFGKSLS